MEVPIGLDLPYWIEDADFDIDFHVRHHAVPPPGNAEQLAESRGRASSPGRSTAPAAVGAVRHRGLSRAAAIAQLTKMHHATIDGASGAEMLAVLLDTDPSYRPATSAPWTPERTSPPTPSCSSAPWSSTCAAPRSSSA